MLKDFNELEENNYIGFPYVIPSLFTAQECRDLILLADDLEIHQAQIGAENRSDLDLSTRNSRIRWMGKTEQTAWVYRKVQYAYLVANQYYKFDLLGCSYFQVTEYPAGGKYDWHEDLGHGLISKRKLSLSVQLSDPADYDGGNLEFVNRLERREDFRKQGSIIVFPSYLAHRVTAVTRGTRWSMIAWVFGPPFR